MLVRFKKSLKRKEARDDNDFCDIFPNVNRRKELKQLLQILTPLGCNSSEAKELRRSSLGTSGMTLETFEDFLEHSLEDTYETFRPIYGIVFRRVSSSTSATQETGVVESEQFHILMRYICLFAFMFDSYICIQKDFEAKMGINEWLARCTTVLQYKFAGFDFVQDLKGNRIGLAAFFFNILDCSEDKRVDLFEWFAYIGAYFSPDSVRIL